MRSVVVFVFAVLAFLGLHNGAEAAPKLDLTFSLSPSPPPIFPNLTGDVQIYKMTLGVDADGKPFTIFTPGPPPIDIGKLLPGGSFGTTFIPVDPCYAGGSCGFAFSFAGLSGDFPAFAFDASGIPNVTPSPPPIIPIGFFDALSPGPPPIFGDLVAFDDPEIIGTWEARISAVPEPGSAALFVSGLILAMGWHLVRTRRRA